jgi:hypothetical protein
VSGRLKQGPPVDISELRKFNRLLIETNYPLESPDRHWMDKFKSKVHEIEAGNEIVYVLKV